MSSRTARPSLVAVVFAGLIALTACASDEQPEESVAQGPAETLSEDVDPGPDAEEDSAVEPEPEPEPDPEPVRDGPEIHHVGDLIERPTADVVVEVLEEREVIETDFEEDYTPGDGERLWYVDITWTNNLPEAVSKECHGPYAMALHAFDLQGREMLMVDQPGYISGQNCSTGLMQGQTGRWQSAFHGLDEDFGWLLFDDYNGEEAVVTLDPDLELFYE